MLYGMHDEEAQAIVPQGGWLLGLVQLNANPAPRQYNPAWNWLIRLNWGYGSDGTIPNPENDSKYLTALGTYLSGTRGATRFIVGNEPNLKGEWPVGKPISAARYRDFYNKVRLFIRTRDSSYSVIPAAMAPYNIDSGDWLTYTRQVLQEIYGCDGINIHAYTRSADPNAISADQIVEDGVLKGQQWGFRTYQDALSVVPPALRGLPAYITEFDEYGPWLDQNTGVIKAAYEEINHWNQDNSHQFVHCLLPYRYPHADQWYIQGKNGVIADFLEATRKGYEAPSGSSSVFIPVISNGGSVTPSTPVENDAVQRHYDEAALRRGVSVEKLAGGPGWYATDIHWYDEKEADKLGGDHHIYYDTLDTAGNRLADVRIRVVWSSGGTTVVSELKPGEPYSANFPMSPSRNDYSTWVLDDLPSEKVTGIGMGADTPSGYNPGIHTDTTVTFRKLNPAAKQPLTLEWPVPDSETTISQKFGENAEDYSHITDSGVPLKGHTGIDIAVPVGTSVYAAADGRAIESDNDPSNPTGFGKYVKLQHDFGETLYAHLSEIRVVPGQQVKQGEVLGKSGATGNVSGPHLHFGLRINPYTRTDGWGGYSDPLPYLNLTEKDSQVEKGLVQLIKQVAQDNNLEWELLASQAWAESSFRPDIPDGIMQIGDATWSDWASKVGATSRNGALDNLKVGAAYMKWLLDKYQNNEWKALYAYNMGPNALDSGETIQPDTYLYANKVIHGRDLLKAIGE